MQKRNRKGFTLAELLIVVAIIAVLVAIAVPLFVSGLQKAEKSRDDANIRSVKSAAVVYILDHTKNETGFTMYVTTTDKDDTHKEGDLYPYFTVTANVSEAGKITISKIEGKKTAPAATEVDTCKAAATGKGWDITAYIDALEFKSGT